MRVKFNILVRIFRWFPASPTYSHLATVSSSHGLYCMDILANTYRCGIRILSAMVWSQGGADYTASPFPEHNYWSCGIYKVLEAVLYLLLTRVIWLSHADLSDSGPHQLIALSLIH